MSEPTRQRRAAEPTLSAPVSLRWKVAAAVCALLVLATVAIAVAVVRYERSYLIAEGEKRAAALARTLAVSVRDPLLEADELRLGPIIQSIMEDPDAVYAYVLDHQGVVVYHFDTQLLGSTKKPVIDGSPTGVLHAEVPVVLEETMVGTAIVGLSSEFVDRAARETAAGLLLRLGIGSLLGLGGVLLLTDFHLRRIARLEQAVSSLASGDLTVRARVRGRDELARLSVGFNSMVARLQEARQEIERGVTDTVSALASAIEVNDAYTRGHCERVAQMTAAIAERRGIEGRELYDFRLAAMLHDIGKIGIPNQILSKKGKLTKAEFRKMKEHSALGARILNSVSFLGQVPLFVRHHHENWNGSGYPDGLEGDDIPFASRIIHVVDAYDAITSSRSYRKALPHDEAIRRLLAARGTEFDPAVIDTFLELVEEGTMTSIRRRIDEQVAA